MYSIYRDRDLIGRSRLERAGYLFGDAQGVFEPTLAFRALQDRASARSSAVAAELETAGRENRMDDDMIQGMIEMALLFDRDGTWPDLEVVSPDGRKLNARVDGFAETSPGRWRIGVTINDAEYWHRAAEGTL